MCGFYRRKATNVHRMERFVDLTAGEILIAQDTGIATGSIL